ncbi:MAG: radical SAM protein [Candidatus Saliniplasma sp.]
MTYEVKSLIYEVTESCDLGCRYCYNYWLDGLEKRDAKKLPSKESWFEITDELLDEVDVDRIVLSGGEPLKLDYVSDLCKYLGSKGVDVDLLTGAQGLTEERVKSLVKSGVKLFEISLLSFEKEEHNDLVGGDNFAETIRAMKLAKKHGADLCTIYDKSAVFFPNYLVTYRFTGHFRG